MLIAFAGRARTGKDTAAKYLVDKYGFNQIALANPVKEGSYAINPWILVTEEEYLTLEIPEIPELWSFTFACYDEGVYFVKLQALVDNLGIDTAKTITGVREFYQKYGTEGGRNIHGEDCWTRIAKTKFTGKDVISDGRFANEAEFAHENRGIVVNLTRDSAEAVNQHASESGLCSEYYDILIENDGTIEELFEELDRIIQ